MLLPARVRALAASRPARRDGPEDCDAPRGHKCEDDVDRANGLVRIHLVLQLLVGEVVSELAHLDDVRLQDRKFNAESLLHQNLVHELGHHVAHRGPAAPEFDLEAHSCRTFDVLEPPPASGR